MKKLLIILLSAFLFVSCNDYSILLNSKDADVNIKQLYYCSSLSQVKIIVAEKSNTKINWDTFENKVAENSFDYVYNDFPTIFIDSYLKSANWENWKDGYYVRIRKSSVDRITIYYLKFDSRIPVTKGNNYLKLCKMYLL